MKRQLVWIIDDDRSIRWVLEKTLKQTDIVVESFENADNILTLLKQKQPDTIISDIRMPGIDGLSLMQQIKSALIAYESSAKS